MKRVDTFAATNDVIGAVLREVRVSVTADCFTSKFRKETMTMSSTSPQLNISSNLDDQVCQFRLPDGRLFYQKTVAMYHYSPRYSYRVDSSTEMIVMTSLEYVSTVKLCRAEPKYVLNLKVQFFATLS